MLIDARKYHLALARSRNEPIPRPMAFETYMVAARLRISVCPNGQRIACLAVDTLSLWQCLPGSPSSAKGSARIYKMCRRTQN